ncbi:MAG: filamentous hemagglutinin N-terminal domain-containing protein [Chthoniobacteraceae bacterium]
MPERRRSALKTSTIRPPRIRRSLWGTMSALTCCGAAALMMPAVFTANARDILRGGSFSSSANSANTTGTSSATTQTATQLRTNALDKLARTTQALSAVQAMQNQARAIAAAANRSNLGLDPNHPGKLLPNVPNGLTTGGLQVLSGGTWTGAKQPKQTVVDGQTIVTIKQTSADALLQWQTFNIGKNTTLSFNQNGGGDNVGKWIAFNEISDPSGSPSQILGSIQAPGQVYVINSNGIIFGGSSQVNVHTLVASSLQINENLISRGLLNNPDDQFLFSALAQPVGSNGTAAFTPTTPLTPNGENGDVVVQQGAQISAPTTADHVGGRVELIGPNVKNAGTISTPDGQTILAAGLQVGFTAHSSSDASLRGLDVFVGAIVDPSSANPAYAGTATNNGLIEALRGDVTIAGKAVNQNGFINSSTSVSYNGRIDLLASYGAVSAAGLANVASFLPTAAGTVTLGADSVMQILPEWDSTDTVVGTALSLRSQVNITGKAIHLGVNSELFAPNAKVTLQAGDWKYVSTAVSGNSLPTDKFVFDKGQIYFDTGADIDVAGSMDVLASVTENIISVQLLGAQLANSPLQRAGILHGQTIQVDIRDSGVYNGYTWVGTPLADAEGYVGLIQRSVGELTIGGGTVSLTAGDSVVMQSGSKVNVSGGYINYQGALVSTTRLLGTDGYIYDIANATPDRTYAGIYTGTYTVDHSKWGTTESYTSSLFQSSHYENSYDYGGSGGEIDITAPSVALDGTLVGQTVAGSHQRTVLPTQSVLDLVFQAQQFTTAYNVLPTSPTPPDIIFQQDSTLSSVAAFALDSSGDPVTLSADRKATVILSPDLVSKDGFGTLIINNSDGNITIPSGVSLTTVAGGSITLSAANLDIEGSITAPGGKLAFTVYDFSPVVDTGSLTATPDSNPDRGNFTLGSTALLSTAGLVVDDRATAANSGTLPMVDNGGSISITSYSANLEAGSTINVSGGALVGGTGKKTYGSGGSISIVTGQDPGIKSILGGTMTLDATLEGYGAGSGGSLAIQAPLIQIGGTSSNPDRLVLSPDFFSQGGFASFSLSGLGQATSDGNFLPGLLIAPGTVIAPQEESMLLFPSATDGNQLVFQPEYLTVSQRTPVSLSFAAVDVKDDYKSSVVILRGDVVLGVGAVINADPGASVSLKGDSVLVDGSIYAPGGQINITGASDSSILLFGGKAAQDALATVLISSNSVLSTAGTTVFTPDVRGYRTGSVLAGGSINISGNIVAETGSLLDVSGTSNVLDYNSLYVATTGEQMPASFTGFAMTPVQVDSNGGSITMTGGQSLFTDATLRGAAGGTEAVGGSLSISSGVFKLITVQTPTTPTIAVSQNGNSYLAGTVGIGQTVRNGKGVAIVGGGNFGVNQFETSGLSSLTIGGVVDFKGAVNIDAASSLSVGSGGFIYANSAVTLTAPYVKLGTAFQGPLTAAELAALEQNLFGGEAAQAAFGATYGTGSLTVNASLIDVGNLSLQGIGNLNLIASNGDIRGDGTLDVAGHIYLQAGQIYPPSAVSFTIAAEDYKVGSTTHLGSVTIAGSGTRQLPLSAGGELNVYGSIIHQGGTLRAPLGVINIGTDGTDSSLVNFLTGQAFATTQKLTLSSGSVTSVSAVDPTTGEAMVIPYGLNLNGISWIDPSGTDITAGGVVSKSVNLSAAKIFDQHGAEIDLRGGGDLYAYRFVSGTGGTHDILNSTTSFAVIPAYQANYSPYAPYNSSATEASSFGTDAGYTNSGLKVGDVIYLAGGDGLAAGYYTLLPARYALLPGAYLVTPQSGVPVGNVSLADGTSMVSGYRVNDLDAARSGSLLNQRFLVASGSVVHDFAEYDDYSANTFLAEGALKNSTAVPRLPTDSGQLVLEATKAMTIQGSVSSQSVSGGKGSLVDISSPVDIVIAGKDFSGGAGELVLNAADLSAIGAESLLIGGVRTFGTNGTTVTVQTGNITVDNAGTPLSGADIILVANNNLTLDAGAQIIQSGVVPGGADTLLLGSSTTTGSGDGALLRLSSDPNAKVFRSGVDITDTSVSMVVGAGVQLVGSALTLDSTYATSLDSSAHLDAQSITLGSGSITIELNNPGTVAPTSGLDISGQVLSNLEAAQNLSLLSYSSINVYGSGSFGNAAMSSLSLHAAEIAGYNTAGGTVQFNAQNILLDNSPGISVTAASGGVDGTLTFNAGTIQLGSNALALDQFATVNMNATGGILSRGSGSLSTQGALVMNTPLITGANSSKHTITAAGALSIKAPAGGGASTVNGGLGASLTLVGQSVDVNSSVVLPSGNLTLHATGGDLTVGDQSTSLLSVAGIAKQFFNLTEYTSGGKLSLISDTGAVTVFSGSKVDVSAQSGGGSAGTLSVSAPDGQFVMNGKMLGQGGNGGTNGSFNLDVSTLVGGAISSLSTDLANGGFTQSLVFRVRNGDVLVDGTTTARSFDLSTDTGSIDVTGTVDASGATGGSISMESHGSLTLESGAVLTVAAQDFSDAGKGGSVTLEAGDETNGLYDTSAVLDIQSGSKIDLSVASNTANSAELGDFTGTLHLRAPQLADNSDLQINPIDGTIVGASSIVVEGYKIFDLTGSGTIDSTVKSNVDANGVAFTGNTATITSRLLANNSGLASVLHVQPGAEIINTSGDLTLTSSWDLSNFRYGPNANSSVRGSGEAGNPPCGPRATWSSISRRA